MALALPAAMAATQATAAPSSSSSSSVLYHPMARQISAISATSTAQEPRAECGPTSVPYQMSDEMYASILRDPTAFGYPVLPEGVVKGPKFGYIFVEIRPLNHRRPKLVDGLDWVPSSTANASTRLLRDGQTELLRYYCARRTKDRSAKPDVKPFTLYQKEHGASIKAEAAASLDSYDVKKLVAQTWRALSAEEQEPFIKEARVFNATSRQRKAHADPSQLLVRHEMCLRVSADGARDGATLPKDVESRYLIHYLGGDAFQLLTIPPRPLRVVSSSSASAASRPASSGPDATRASPDAPGLHDGLVDGDAIPWGMETASLRLSLGSVLHGPTPQAPAPPPLPVLPPPRDSPPIAPCDLEIGGELDLCAAIDLFGVDDVFHDMEPLAAAAPPTMQRRACGRPTRSASTREAYAALAKSRRPVTPPPPPPAKSRRASTPPPLPPASVEGQPSATDALPRNADELLLLTAVASPLAWADDTGALPQAELVRLDDGPSPLPEAEIVSVSFDDGDIDANALEAWLA